jgi:hypothetical protein
MELTRFTRCESHHHNSCPHQEPPEATKVCYNISYSTYLSPPKLCHVFPCILPTKRQVSPSQMYTRSTQLPIHPTKVNIIPSYLAIQARVIIIYLPYSIFPHQKESGQGRQELLIRHSQSRSTESKGANKSNANPKPTLKPKMQTMNTIQWSS